MPETYACRLTVTKVEERFRIVSGRKNPDGSADMTTRSIGWWIVTAPDGIAYCVGPEKPEIRDGDEVVLRIEPVVAEAAAALDVVE